MGKQTDSEPGSQTPTPDQSVDFEKVMSRHFQYQEYLENFKYRPPLTGCTGPMSFGEWDQYMNIVEPLLNPSKPPTKPE